MRPDDDEAEARDPTDYKKIPCSDIKFISTKKLHPK